MPVRLSPAIRASASTHASMARLRSKLLRLPRLNRTPESCGIAFVIAPAVNERLAGDSLRSTVSAAIMEQLMSSIMPYVRDPPRLYKLDKGGPVLHVNGFGRARQARQCGNDADITADLVHLGIMLFLRRCRLIVDHFRVVGQLLQVDAPALQFELSEARRVLQKD